MTEQELVTRQEILQLFEEVYAECDKQQHRNHARRKQRLPDHYNAAQFLHRYLCHSTTLAVLNDILHLLNLPKTGGRQERCHRIVDYYVQIRRINQVA